MNIVMRELKAYRKSLIFWCIGMVLMIAAGMGKYAGLSSTDQSMNDLISTMPKALQAMMGAGSFDISTASGYYGLLYLYLLLIATIHAAVIGSTMIAKEERDKTVEFLFVKPVTRSRVIASKLIAALINVFILTLVTWSSCLLIVGKYSNGEAVFGEISITMIGMFILQLIFLMIGAVISSVTKKVNKASSLSAGFLFMTFILSVAIDLNDRIEGLKYLTPFKYFEAKNVMYDQGLNLVFLIISFVIISGLTLITFVYFKKRDLNI